MDKSDKISSLEAPQQKQLILEERQASQTLKHAVQHSGKMKERKFIWN